ncbi:glycoside hydrolase family 15 protein [Streptomyces sp. NRRL F-5630]|uniref:glycoside hydrolase family 15 protein n=1 Tax=unclassified Streptomyces TaxID=2593676 RepID=UPI0004CBE841|nr:glycoside hydrolase family 15 protein [Streptomyces sp. NRRL F-5630]
MTTSLPIERYGLIGNTRTAALVADTGEIDWLCAPDFDGPAVFAALLGAPEHGTWRLAPAVAPQHGSERGAGVSMSRRYVQDSLVLESEWRTTTGAVRVTDFMPLTAGTTQVIRIVEGLVGEVAMVSELRARPGYGRVVPWVHEEGGRIVAEGGGVAVWLDGPCRQTEIDDDVVGHFVVAAGTSAALALSVAPAHEAPPRVPDPDAALLEALGVWREFASRCTYRGPHREAVVRSALTLKALTYAPSGAIVAAPTTSLPEEIGGERNWDYRHAWVRDSAGTLAALIGAGYQEEAVAWRRWLLRAVGSSPLRIMYGLRGEHDLPERDLYWLPGYAGSAPVRVGNGAAQQVQLDVYGELIETLYLAHEAGIAHCEDTAALHRRLIAQVEAKWQQPDAGIWEGRGALRHYVHSKVMLWVAVDRTARLAEDGALPLDPAPLRELAARIHAEVCEKGFDPVRNTFTQSYGSTDLDAALLLIPAVGFLPGDDPRVLGTIDAVREALSTPDGFVYRYPTKGDTVGADGLAGDEGAFLLCSFWLVDALALSGRIEEARPLYARLLGVRNDLGLASEEYAPGAGRLLGNFPQTYTHEAIIRSALLLQHVTARGARDVEIAAIEEITPALVRTGAGR